MGSSSVRLPDPDPLRLDFITSVNLEHLSQPEVEALERDLELASQMQRHLFPCCVPALANLEVAAHLRPAGIVSGDFFDFFCYGETGQGILVADIMGKGLPASMVMANIQATMRALGCDYHDAGAMMARLNRLFREHMKPGVFASMVVVTYDPETDTLRYTNAGHLPPLLWRNQTQSVEWLESTGPAIGLMDKAIYSSDQVKMDSGDVMLLFTDGLTEARNNAGEEFEAHRLVSFIAEHHDKPAGEIITALNTSLQEFVKGNLLDDLTLLILKWK